MLQLAPPPASLLGASAPSPRKRLDALADAELALLARGVGEHLPCELADQVLAVRAERAALVRLLGVERVF